MASALRAIALRRPLSLLPRPVILSVSTTRSFIGLGEIAGVIANPAETLRQLNESKQMLQKAKEDMELSREAKKIPKKHTFSKLPGFHGRKAEQALLRKILSNNPKMTVIFGATSVGKTALLREVLATDDYFVVKFDLRISGFADLRTLYLALCEQFQTFFEGMHDKEMDKQGLTFKHLILEMTEKDKQEGGHEVTVADLASLMESLQSCLLKYWEYDPATATNDQNKDTSSDSSGSRRKPAVRKVNNNDESIETQAETKTSDETSKPKFQKRPIVFLLDEAHKLPALVDNNLSLKVFLDTLLVLTKQDRLCHVLLSTSDSFFHHFLRSMNVGHHAQILTIGDCNREETLNYFHEKMLPQIPQRLASRLNFDDLWDVFGGKLSHINDYISSWVNSDGEMTPYQSAIFIQAYTLLQFHLTHLTFETFSPLSDATAGVSTKDDNAKFSPSDLIRVMKQLVKSPYSLPYFSLCRQIGTQQVDSMIKTRILELRWTRTIVPEEEGVERVWSRDGIERPIVLPMTRIIRKAMEVVLKEDDVMEDEKASKAKHAESEKK